MPLNPSVLAKKNCKKNWKLLILIPVFDVSFCKKP